MNSLSFLLPEDLKIKTHILHSTMTDEAQDAYSDPVKGHASQTRVSLESHCDCPPGTLCIIITSIRDTATAHL